MKHFLIILVEVDFTIKVFDTFCTEQQAQAALTQLTGTEHQAGCYVAIDESIQIRPLNVVSYASSPVSPE